MMNNKLIDKSNIWLMVAILFFAVTKIVALICATVVAVRGNLYIGSALFIGALVFRITWTFTPTLKEMENIQPKKVNDE